MKKLVLLVIAAVMIASMAFAGCAPAAAPASEAPASEAPASEAPASEAPASEAPASEAPASEAPAAEAKGKKIAGVVFQEDQFMKLLQMGYKDAAEKAGYEFFPGNTNNDAAKEVEMINTYVTQGYAGLAISPISETASIEPLKNAAGQGLIIGLSNSNLGSLDWMTACYTSDNYQLGQMTGEAAAKYIEANMGGKAKIGILQFKTLLPEQSTARSDGFKDAVSKLPGVEIVDDQDAWLQDKAITVATDMLSAKPDINMIWAANEGGTIGATMAIKNAGKAGSVVSFGTDASEQMVALLQDGDNILQAVTGQDPYEIGVKTMNSVISGIEGKEDPDKGKTIIVPGILLSRANPDELTAFLDNLKSKIG